MAHSSVLVVEHETDAPAGWLGQSLEELGVRLDIARPYAGEVLPDDLDDHAGLLVLGGAMDSWDDAGSPWLPQTRALVRVAEAQGRPVLGICLGHQVAAAALGGEVGRNPAGSTVAVLPVMWGPFAVEDPLLGPARGATHAVHWNNDVVLAVPPGGQVLATSPDGAVQAARLGRHVWGVQFHPEAHSAILESWVAGYGTNHQERGADLDRFLAEARRLAPELEESCRLLAGSFAARLRRERP
ncbi:MAG TPA: type 1 glutamine amidotransferase [Marmoricola sp.]|nr:type 1 glutamine amidotransferase [Marmoricola sp.]